MNPGATSTCRHKCRELESLIADSHSDVPVKFVAVTETWLRDHIRDKQLHIEGFNISRCDRADRKGGGVLLYSHRNFPIEGDGCRTYEDSYCLVLFVKFPSLRLGVFVLYRPPDAPNEKFHRALSFVQRCIDDLDSSFQVCMVGDFNLPSIDWRTEKTLGGRSVQSRESAQELLRFLNHNFMNQYVDQPTRDTNILDLFCANNPGLVQSMAVVPSELSDHSMVSALVSIPVTELDGLRSTRAIDDGFASLDFSRADYPGISEAIQNVNWTELERQYNLEEYPAIFTKNLLEICRLHVPMKRPRSGPGRSGRPRDVNALRRKRKRIRHKIALLPGQVDNPAYGYLLDKVQELNLQIKSAYQRDFDRRELAVIEKIKSNPKVFYSYAKSHSVVRNDVAMLRDEDGNPHVQPRQIADALQEHFSSVYSDPNCEEVCDPL